MTILPMKKDKKNSFDLHRYCECFRKLAVRQNLNIYFNGISHFFIYYIRGAGGIHWSKVLSLLSFPFAPGYFFAHTAISSFQNSDK